MSLKRLSEVEWRFGSLESRWWRLRCQLWMLMTSRVLSAGKVLTAHHEQVPHPST